MHDCSTISKTCRWWPHRQTTVTHIESEVVHHDFAWNGVRVVITSFECVTLKKNVVVLTRQSDIALLECSNHGLMFWCAPMCRNTNNPTATVCKERKREPVITGIQFEIFRNLRHEVCGFCWSASSIFERLDVRHRVCQLRKSLCRNFSACANWDVINNNWQCSCVCHGSDMPGKSTLWRAVVIRPHCQNSGSTHLRDFFCHVHGVRSVVRTRTSNDGNSDCVNNCFP